MSDVLIVEDDPILRGALEETMSLAGHSYLAAKDGREALAMLDKHCPLIVLSDIRMDNLDGQQLLSEIQRRNPGMPVILMTAYGSIEDAVSATRHGAVDYLQKPFSTHVLTEKIKRYLKPTVITDKEPITQDPKSNAIFAMARRLAQSDIGVMITGESGTGKEVLARFIHQQSQRQQQPFIAINCAAIPEQMLEATLFGYEKGAFTGAYKAAPGKFEQAQGGTLLLDEVSEMSLNLQAKLLRVLQEKEVERIGASKLIRLNVRVLATSNRHLLDDVNAGRFREDLYYRLNIFPLHWLPLRERIGDIIPLANFFIRRHTQNDYPVIPVLSEQAIDALIYYPWPGNVRELENIIQRGLILQTQGVIEPCHLHLPVVKPADIVSVLTTPGEIKKLQNHEYHIIEQTLKSQLGNRQQVAASLGISERTLRYKLAKMREEGYAV